MDVKGFADALLTGLATADLFESVALQTEGPIASARATVSGAEDLFLRVYFNESTGTTAFALIKDQRRIWGVDFDNRRGWHLPPHDDPTEHRSIAPLSIQEIVRLLTEVLSNP